MNRRKFFSFLAVAPVAVMAATPARAEPNIDWISRAVRREPAGMSPSLVNAAARQAMAAANIWRDAQYLTSGPPTLYQWEARQ